MARSPSRLPFGSLNKLVVLLMQKQRAEVTAPAYGPLDGGGQPETETIGRSHICGQQPPSTQSAKGFRGAAAAGFSRQMRRTAAAGERNWQRATSAYSNEHHTNHGNQTISETAGGDMLFVSSGAEMQDQRGMWYRLGADVPAPLDIKSHSTAVRSKPLTQHGACLSNQGALSPLTYYFREDMYFAK
ncbi:hypothetical protein BCR34DRAFT_584835 [Clohesyomyces aquaticus]|uniref:Uncharacterized protein n=1 Tax=Clohesyomyces aquaticus TaxID=1231657 RepID=A0A1Y2A0G2_9PLEO|nr:hypothetical protein BCR34DRAFT_584835 [Clohesyomyces aquaticus]